MIDASSVSTAANTTAIYGPWILALLGVMIAMLGWFFRRVFSRQDKADEKLSAFAERLVKVETKQSMSFENTVQVARKVGVPDRQIQQPEKEQQ